MARLKLQGGYTLIEVILVLAIVSGLLAAIWNGQAQIRNRNKYSASIEGLKNTLKRVQNEATTTVNTAGNGKSGQFVFGKMVVFNPASNNATVYTLVANDSDPNSSFLTESDSYSFSIGQNVVLKPPFPGTQCQAIVFSRAPDYIWVPPEDPNCYINNATGSFTYGNYYRENHAVNPGVANFSLVDPDFGYSADIVVDTQNSTITRVFH